MFALPRILAAALFATTTASLAIFPAGASRADGPKDNIADNVRPVPPVGNTIPDADADEIKKGLAELQQLIKDIGKHDLLPDVQVYEKAVRWALDYKEIYDGKGAKPATNVKKVLAAGLERAKQLKGGQAPWATQTGSVVRAYTSKIDGSVQPYWLIVPKDYDFTAKTKHRLDFWWHGRFENVVEAGFMANSPGTGGIIPAPGALILHPFGRFSNANKFAGEIDTFECLEHAKKHYCIDESRLVARGFSMGGAACWQYAVHYPTLWAANAPGAGFSETPEFLKVFQQEKLEPTWYEQKLWHMYNATDTAVNIFNLPTVAYSGEVDSQKQAADVMAREMKKVGLELTHIIGPKTGHSYEKGAKAEVNKQIDAFVEKGKPAKPSEIKFTTYTLRYNQCGWVEITGLEKHWSEAKVTGKTADGTYELTTRGVSAFNITTHERDIVVKIDGKTVLTEMGIPTDKPRVKRFVKVIGRWAVPGNLPDELKKAPGLQGPIDDAFMDSFVMVKPTGKAANEKIGAWVAKEMKHAVEHWQKQFRGGAPVKNDTEVTDADIKNSNLVLWGDPSSNAVLAKIADKLPVKWTNKGVVVGKDTYDAGTHVPVLIYPNPLNPKKYVVLNSGFTFREYDYLNNARQVSKLPDYAVIDVTTPPNSRYPGKVTRAGFFGEKWELLENDGK
ncbi:prolyl oligopeptidase family protein : Prolyl oligopeptidase family protein OS=Singulisphaera acidiphila (strain ATCC BAA-1392 / DSM 18658 / VKM B-2454 / MOB10) GN=Sinac_5332 PE=4 SV=1: Peptidase_S9 [Gemmata massiliana]|uniref:Peptidase S9 prolyl oligopeptidase catalytic domain-containing protein n=1 Tax=Gemmata massiliana TaxID=1210884 RepID=A0A6P2CXD0_9BACT|nr:prolyl oligopeptidase family serine peptidase [Gemmata massiliana]VTR92404.1 prolyl oligopeptidase family protein : Prolyl oligopeptidase family protein OS=Singulisphaera acidiphila (strain ATCC BAA-1392 / DSM 18658 / VKM B-2454 / MOB10) GN=Sinac_5332 PE=4 SV=1: Peptidase_S9 [Gemmata massiliana]